MNHGNSDPLHVHLVGSIPLPDAEAVFRTLAGALGPHLRRIPDGETGDRMRWIGFIARTLAVHPDFEVDPDLPVYQFKQWDGQVVFEIDRLRFKPGVDSSQVTFDTGYANDAIRSFAIFDRLQTEGVIPEGVKYQACSASPLAITYMYLSPGSREDFTRIYTDHLIGEVRRIADTLPNGRISYQWDVCQEVLMWENYFDQPPGYKDEIISTLGRVGNAVPETIDLGYHLCYGSPRDEHMIQPTDIANLVEMANGIVAAAGRPVQYIHMPVPRDRNDDEYFRPLRDLKLPAVTGLYLGLVHGDDGSGNAARLSLARKYATVAGIAAECGLGRSNPADFAQVLDAHWAVVDT